MPKPIISNVLSLRIIGMALNSANVNFLLSNDSKAAHLRLKVCRIQFYREFINVIYNIRGVLLKITKLVSTFGITGSAPSFELSLFSLHNFCVKHVFLFWVFTDILGRTSYVKDPVYCVFRQQRCSLLRSTIKAYLIFWKKFESCYDTYWHVI